MNKKQQTLDSITKSQKAAQNEFYYQGAMIYNSLTRDIRMQENENLFLKRLRKFNF